MSSRGVFRHLTLSSSAAVHTSLCYMTLSYVKMCHIEKFVSLSWCLVHPAADDDFVICWNAPYGQRLVLPSQRLVHPAADHVFVICWNAPYGQVLVLPSWCLVCTAADDDFVICRNAPYGQEFLMLFFSGAIIPLVGDDIVLLHIVFALFLKFGLHYLSI